MECHGEALALPDAIEADWGLLMVQKPGSSVDMVKISHYLQGFCYILVVWYFWTSNSMKHFFFLNLGVRGGSKVNALANPEEVIFQWRLNHRQYVPICCQSHNNTSTGCSSLHHFFLPQESTRYFWTRFNELCKKTTHFDILFLMWFVFFSKIILGIISSHFLLPVWNCQVHPDGCRRSSPYASRCPGIPGSQTVPGPGTWMLGLQWLFCCRRLNPY